MTTKNTVRDIALDALLEILEHDRYSHIVVGRTLDKFRYLSRQERAFLKRLIEGTVECRIQEDYVIGQFSTVKMKKMKPVIRTILRMSVYQLFHMDSVPDSAVCNEAVKLATSRGFSGLRGFVNGVLRNIARKKDTVTWPDRSVRYSMPQWILDRWDRDCGKEACDAMLNAFSEPSGMTVRVVEGLAPEPVIRSLEEEGAAVTVIWPDRRILRLDGVDQPDMLRAFQEGKIRIQDLSSALQGYAAGFRSGDTVIDVCGAPGGKAIHAAELVGPEGHVTVRDLSENKILLTEANIAQTGLSNLTAEVRDASRFVPEDEESCDVLICDLPCSGLGVIGRKPDIRYHASEEAIRDLAGLQRTILETVWKYVKHGGTLIYSTCTVTREENEENRRWFLEHFPFEAVDITGRFGNGLDDGTLKEGYVQLLPGAHPCDGFFIAVFRRQ